MTKAKATNAQTTRKGSSARAAERRISHAVNHPVRLDALSILIERQASPKEIAKALQVSLGTASFHVAELLADDAIELVKTMPRRGAVEHYYRAKQRPEVSDDEWRKMPKPARRKLAAILLQAIIAEGLASLRNGKMDTDDDLYLVWKVVKLDVRGRKEVADLHAEMLSRLEAIREQNDLRAADDGDTEVRIVAMMGFERARVGDPPSGDDPPLPTARK